MPHYYFHVSDSSGELRDEEGRELPELVAARQVALKSARSLICADVMQGRLDLDGVLEVTDEAGNQILLLSYRTAVGLAGG